MLVQRSVASLTGQSSSNNFFGKISDFLNSILDPGEVPEIKGVTR